MDATRFDNLTRSLQRLAPRRAALSVLGGSLAALLPRLGRDDASAKKNRKKSKKKVKFNDFGCVNVGSLCKNNGQCCSGICKGKKGKKKCKAHDQSTCLAGQTACGGAVIDCVTPLGQQGFCETTTGNAGYCQVDGGCFACTKDADCVPFCGPEAACIVCENGCEEEGNTLCVGPSEDSCAFPQEA
jgi:hypothetical protein